MSNANETRNRGGRGKAARKAALTGLLCAAFLASGTGLMITGIRAYLTHTDRAINTFTVGEVTIDTMEPNYPGNGSDEVKDQVPMQETNKDPVVKNTGKNRAIVFMQVDIPMANIIVANEDGTRLARANTELFGFRTKGGGYNSVHSEQWSELATQWLDAADKPVDKDKAVKARRIYGYRSVVEEDMTTLPIFDVVRLCNVVEGYIDNSIRNIVVTSYAIQADNIEGITTQEFSEITDPVVLTRIFNVYMNQSKAIEPGKADDGNQTLIGTTLNVTMTVNNTHLKLQSGDTADARTTADITIAYTGPNDHPSPTFTSSDESVVTVDPNGIKMSASEKGSKTAEEWMTNIRAVGVGEAVITVEVPNPDTGNVARATVTVSVKDMNSGEHAVSMTNLVEDDLEAVPFTITFSDAEAADGADAGPADDTAVSE